LSIDLSGANLGTGATALNIDTTDLTTQANAQAALTAIDTAIDTVNGVLGELGAYQNRLDYASSSIGTTIQNYKASESVIRDVDMAAEMVDFTKFQILQQVGTAMLAQANAAPQGILSLVR
jgi:flagellin